MAKKKSLISMLADNNISFDFIENEKGKKAYEDEFISIDAENADEYAKTGNFSGLRIYNFTPEEIPNFDKVCGDANIWSYPLPIEEISISDMTEKQVISLLGVAGSALKSLYLNYSKFNNLELDMIVKNCPNLSKLELDDQNWEREDRLPIELKKIGKQKFESVICRKFASKGDVDWSTLNIESLELDECDASKIIFPDKLKKLVCTATNDKVTLMGAKNLSELELSVNNEAVKSIDLKSLAGLHNLDLQILDVAPKITLPDSLRVLSLGTSESSKCSLSFLKVLHSLESLSIKSTDQGFKDYSAISGLSKLRYFKFDENGVGKIEFKSDFKTEYLNGLKELEALHLRYVVNLSDFSFVKDMSSLKSIEIDTSRVKTLKGIELGNFETLHMSDCHAISDLSFISKSKVSNFKFIISDIWATKVEMTPKQVVQLADSNLQRAEIVLNKMKIVKKDLKPLEKLFELEVDGDSLSLERK